MDAEGGHGPVHVTRAGAGSGPRHRNTRTRKHSPSSPPASTEHPLATHNRAPEGRCLPGPQRGRRDGPTPGTRRAVPATEDRRHTTGHRPWQDREHPVWFRSLHRKTQQEYTGASLAGSRPKPTVDHPTHRETSCAFPRRPRGGQGPRPHARARASSRSRPPTERAETRTEGARESCRCWPPVRPCA